MIEVELHARRSAEFAGDFYGLQGQKIEALERIIAKYFAHLGRTSPLPVADLARIFDALGNGLSLQVPPGRPGEPNEAGRIMNRLLEALAAPQANASAAG